VGCEGLEPRPVDKKFYGLANGEAYKTDANFQAAKNALEFTAKIGRR